MSIPISDLVNHGCLFQEAGGEYHQGKIREVEYNGALIKPDKPQASVTSTVFIEWKNVWLNGEKMLRIEG
jgi:hypothetical protein